MGATAKIGGSKSKTTDSGTRDLTSVTTATAPDWLTQFLQKNTASATDLAAANPQNYVAPENGYQTNALNTVDKLTGSPWNFDSAADVTRGVINAKNPLGSDYMAAYENPYKDQVVNAATADFDANAGKTRAQQSLDLANQGAFGGSGAALTKSATEGELSRARNSTVSGLLDQMFNTSANLGQQDASRAIQTRAQRLQGAQQLVDLSGAYDQNQRANADALSTMGGKLQDTQQKQDQAPLDLMTWLNSQGVNSDLLSKLFGSTTNENEKTTGTSKTNGFQWGLSGTYGSSGSSGSSGKGG